MGGGGEEERGGRAGAGEVEEGKKEVTAGPGDGVRERQGAAEQHPGSDARGGQSMYYDTLRTP